jgi:hypothetical protein
MQSTTRRATLAPADEAAALAAPIRGLAFIPSAQLDEAVILERFGQPAERIRVNEHQEHLLYPAKGLDLVSTARAASCCNTWPRPASTPCARRSWPRPPPASPASPDAAGA